MTSRIPEIQAKLPKLVGDAVEQAAERIATRARVTAPVETGELKASIDTRRAGPERSEIVAAWYWFLVEYGHEAGGPGPRGGVTGPADPRPFMIPAAESVRPQLVADVRRALGDL